MRECILIDEPNEEASSGKQRVSEHLRNMLFVCFLSEGQLEPVSEPNTLYHGRDFKIVIDSKISETPVSDELNELNASLTRCIFSSL